MLINFTFGNWMSFRDKATIDLVASREQFLGDSVSRVRRIQTRLLPVAMVFGGNASGKTNLFKALAFLKNFVTRDLAHFPESPIPVDCFRLDESYLTAPSTFEVAILVGDDVYRYNLAADGARVVLENLVRLTAPKEDFSFERRFDAASGTDSIAFGKALQGDRAFLDLLFKATRKNQPFLRVAAQQNAVVFQPVFNWFDKTLQMIEPTGRFAHIEAYADKSWTSTSGISSMLEALDTGISEIRKSPVSPNEIPIPRAFLDDVVRSMKDGSTTRIRTDGRCLPFLITKNGDAAVFEKLSTYHKARGGGAEFEFEHESDGTLRILDLLPALAELHQTEPKVYVIDEIDRCLHTLATERIIRLFRDGRNADSRSQLVASTHDTRLMNCGCMRRDEMWLATRDGDTGASTLESVSNYRQARKDSDIQGSYLDGRMSGVPNIHVFE